MMFPATLESCRNQSSAFFTAAQTYSTFLVHLTRDDSDSSGQDARTKLLSMAASSTIEARRPLGMAGHLDSYLIDGVGTQRMVCFTETPLQHV
jgi:hypothetical protein